MIVEKFHHMHRGTHDAPALFEWLSGCRWLPVSVDAIRADFEANGPDKFMFLPWPVPTWVRDNDRVSDATVMRGLLASKDKMEAAGWRLVSLFDLGDVLAHLGRLGFRCRGCQQVFSSDPRSRALVCWPTEYEPEADALCALCARASDQVMRQEPAAVERAARMPFLVADARAWVHEMQKVRKDRVPLSVRVGVKVLSELVGAPPPW